MYELIPPDLSRRQLQAEARAITRRLEPRTLQQILTEARQEMQMEDAYHDWLAGRPVQQLRHPRRTLRQWLTGRRPEPAPAPMQTEIVPVWHS